MVSVWFWDGLEIVGWFRDGLGVVGEWLDVVWGWFGIVWGWFGGVVGGQWDGEIWVTIRAGLLSHWPVYRLRRFALRMCRSVSMVVYALASQTHIQHYTPGGMANHYSLGPRILPGLPTEILHGYTLGSPPGTWGNPLPPGLGW